MMINEYKIFGYISLNADTKGRVICAIRKLAKICQMSDWEVRSSLKRLVANGKLTRTITQTEIEYYVVAVDYKRLKSTVKHTRNHTPVSNRSTDLLCGKQEIMDFHRCGNWNIIERKIPYGFPVRRILTGKHRGRWESSKLLIEQWQIDYLAGRFNAE